MSENRAYPITEDDLRLMRMLVAKNKRHARNGMITADQCATLRRRMVDYPSVTSLADADGLNARTVGNHVRGACDHAVTEPPWTYTAGEGWVRDAD